MLVVGLRIYKAIYFIRHTLGVYGVNDTVMFKSEYYKHLEFSRTYTPAVKIVEVTTGR